MEGKGGAQQGVAADVQKTRRTRRVLLGQVLQVREVTCLHPVRKALLDSRSAALPDRRWHLLPRAGRDHRCLLRPAVSERSRTDICLPTVPDLLRCRVRGLAAHSPLVQTPRLLLFLRRLPAARAAHLL